MSAKSNLDFVSMTIRRYARCFRRLIVNYNDKTSIMIMIMMIGYEVQGIIFAVTLSNLSFDMANITLRFPYTSQTAIF